MIVRPCDIREGDRFEWPEGHWHTATSDPLPVITDGRPKVCVITDRGQCVWPIQQNAYAIIPIERNQVPA